jgi:hypothetical protein
MTRKYSTTFASGKTLETSLASEARSIQNYGDGQTFSLSGKDVDAVPFFAAVDKAIADAWTKKEQTHKRVRTLHGSSVACYVEKWVKK